MGYGAFTIGKVSLLKAFFVEGVGRRLPPAAIACHRHFTVFVVHDGLDEIEAALDVAFVLRDVSTG